MVKVYILVTRKWSHGFKKENTWVSSDKKVIVAFLKSNGFKSKSRADDGSTVYQNYLTEINAYLYTFNMDDWHKGKYLED